MFTLLHVSLLDTFKKHKLQTRQLLIVAVFNCVIRQLLIVEFLFFGTRQLIRDGVLNFKTLATVNSSSLYS